MRIIQFTDPHIGGDGQDAHGVDTRKNLKTTLAAISEENADIIVLTGDLCFREPRTDVYTWIKSELDVSGIDPLMISGNHDDTVMMCESFELAHKDGELYYERVWEGWKVIFLDSSRGKMSEGQWAWFESAISGQAKVLIFTHYPPIRSYVPYMDNAHAFRQQDRFKKMISDFGGEAHVFCGHYHVDKTISEGNFHVHITPSGFFQIRDDMEDFGVDHYDIGYRIIRLEGDIISHSVRYLEGDGDSLSGVEEEH